MSLNKSGNTYFYCQYSYSCKHDCINCYCKWWCDVHQVFDCAKQLESQSTNPIIAELDNVLHTIEFNLVEYPWHGLYRSLHLIQGILMIHFKVCVTCLGLLFHFNYTYIGISVVARKESFLEQFIIHQYWSSTIHQEVHQK